MPVSLDTDPVWLLQHAIDHAIHFEIAIYDAVYLALAQTTRIQFVTADKKLSDLVSGELPFVHYLGDLPVP
jgi:predicted nucleic acid-binding protein